MLQNLFGLSEFRGGLAVSHTATSDHAKTGHSQDELYKHYEIENKSFVEQVAELKELNNGYRKNLAISNFLDRFLELEATYKVKDEYEKV